MSALRRLAIGLVVLALTPVAGVAQAPKSGDIAAVLTEVLRDQSRDAVAAQDPEAPDRFIAALYIADSQLLVVSATYPVPVLLEQRLKRGEFREVYTDLQSVPADGGRFFVHDMEANGLRPGCEPGQPFDLVYEGERQHTTFNGDPVGQKLSQAEYDQRFKTADERYARMLQALVNALRAQT
jgi:hypothetical protein